jgi:pimeloyl-ACP methyl ester carboxylesterase
MALALAYEHYGAGKPVVILHGLFGSARNWQAIAKRLAGEHCVYTLDLRNHGASPWADSMTYREMAEDVRAFIEQQQLAPLTLIGHSMGGKVAMVLALEHASLVQRLVIVDIAPVTYEHSFLPYVQAMQDLNLTGLERRDDADTALGQRISDTDIRMFLLQNLVFRERHFDWRINLAALAKGSGELTAFPDMGHQNYDGPALFVHGGDSTYLQPQHRPVIERRFPRARIVAVRNAGHWVHVDQPVRFIELLEGFIHSDGA